MVENGRSARGPIIWLVQRQPSAADWGALRAAASEHGRLLAPLPQDWAPRGFGGGYIPAPAVHLLPAPWPAGTWPAWPLPGAAGWAPVGHRGFRSAADSHGAIDVGAGPTGRAPASEPVGPRGPPTVASPAPSAVAAAASGHGGAGAAGARRREELAALVHEWPTHAVSAGTGEDYRRAYAKFCAFCEEVGCEPHGVESVHMYAAALGLEGKQWSTIRKALSGIKAHLERLGRPLPDSATSARTLRGLQAQTQRAEEKAKAFFPEQIEAWLRTDDFMQRGTFVQHRDLALVLTMTFGFLRYDDAQRLRRCDVAEAQTRGATRPGLALVIRADKTNQARRGRDADDVGRLGARLVAISDMPSLGPLDPARALRRYLAHFSPVERGQEVPLFAKAWGAGEALSYTYINVLPKRIATSLGLDAGDYSSHSFRHTGPTWAALGGAPKRLLDTHGRWSHRSATSEAYVDAAAELQGQACAFMEQYVSGALQGRR
eukprot:tig00000246_g21500.t1